jgi:hypothetical protein
VSEPEKACSIPGAVWACAAGMRIIGRQARIARQKDRIQM